MHIKAEFNRNGSPALTAFSAEAAVTDIVFQHQHWWGIADTTLPQDRHEEAQHDFTTLTTQLDSHQPESLTEAIAGRLFSGHFFMVLLNTQTREVWIARDTAGAKSGYVAWEGDTLFVGTCMQDVANSLEAARPSLEASRQLMALDFLFDGQSYYDNVAEVPMGNTWVIKAPDNILRHERPLALPSFENDLSSSENSQGLRQQILNAHARRAGSSNVVLLSGGVDSAAMLCSLVEVAGRTNVRAQTFRVKGTHEDETVYAMNFAKHLGVECELREIDPSDEALFEHFERDVLRMNNPYLGRWIFGQFQASPQDVYFAGQDTRLHTPDLNAVDKLAFSLLPYQQNALTRGASSLIAHTAGSLGAAAMRFSNQRSIRGLRRAALAFDLDQYLPRYFFKLLPEKFEKHGFAPAVIDHVRDRLHVDWKQAANQRDLYNRIVATKWGEQYTDDMRYLQDVARMNGTYMALPFYDMELARFSAALPFEQATRFMEGRDKFSNKMVKVNKFLLREAFKGQLNDEQYFRHKAVSRSQYLMLSGPLGRKLHSLLSEALRNDRPWLDSLGATESAQLFVSRKDFQPEDEEFLTKLYYLATNYILKSRRSQYTRQPHWVPVELA